MSNSGRVVLESVPRVGFYPAMQKHPQTRDRCPEDVPLTGCLRACLEFLGEGLGCWAVGQWNRKWKLTCANAFLLGVTGAAFRLSWKEGWHGDNSASWLVSGDPSEVFRRAFHAIGWDLELVCREQLRQQGGRDYGLLFRRRIIQSIDAGKPVIAHGVIGPPEECIVAGYDEGGDVLIGWNYFAGFPEVADTIETEPNGMFRKGDWEKDTWDLLVFGEQRDPPDVKDTLTDAFRWALEVMHRGVTYGDRHNGLEAFDVWARHLADDAGFAAADEADLARRMEAHDNAVGMLAEGRWYGSAFLADAAKTLPFQASHLMAASSACAEIHELTWKMWGVLGGIGRSAEHARKLAQPAVRRELIELVARAKALDERVARHFRTVLDS